jgi:glutamate racemase
MSIGFRRSFASDCLVLRHGSADLVDLAEAKLRGEQPGLDRYRAALAGLLAQPEGKRIDTVVLACTHFRSLRKNSPLPRLGHCASSTARKESPAARPGCCATGPGQARLQKTTLCSPAARPRSTPTAPALARFGYLRVDAL